MLRLSTRALKNHHGTPMSILQALQGPFGPMGVHGPFPGGFFSSYPGPGCSRHETTPSDDAQTPSIQDEISKLEAQLEQARSRQREHEVQLMIQRRSEERAKESAARAEREEQERVQLEVQEKERAQAERERRAAAEKSSRELKAVVDSAAESAIRTAFEQTIGQHSRVERKKYGSDASASQPASLDAKRMELKRQMIDAAAAARGAQEATATPSREAPASCTTADDTPGRVSGDGPCFSLRRGESGRPTVNIRHTSEGDELVMEFDCDSDAEPNTSHSDAPHASAADTERLVALAGRVKSLESQLSAERDARRELEDRVQENLSSIYSMLQQLSPHEPQPRNQMSRSARVASSGCCHVPRGGMRRGGRPMFVQGRGPFEAM